MNEFETWWSMWVGSDGDGYNMDVHKRHAKAAWDASRKAAAAVFVTYADRIQGTGAGSDRAATALRTAAGAIIPRSAL